MKIGEYEQMMSYLTRPAFEDGTPLPKKKPYTIENFKSKVDLYLQGMLGTSNKEYFRDLIIAEYDKAKEAGVDTKAGLEFIKEKRKMYDTLIDEGRRQGEPAQLGPAYGVERMDFKRGTPLGFKRPEKLTFDDLNKDGEFEKFFKEYLEKKSKVQVAGRARETKLWPIMAEALKTVPANASVKEKYNAIKNFDKRDSEYGYTKSKTDHKVSRRLTAAINASFEDSKKGINKINIQQLADEIPAYSYKSLQAIFGNAKRDASKIKGQDKASRNKRNLILNAKAFVKRLKDLGLVITQGDTEQRTRAGTGAGKAYLFEPLSEELKTKLKEIKPLRASDVPYDEQALRKLVAAYSRASEDYKKFGFSKSGYALDQAANALNEALIEQFTTGVPESNRNISAFNDAMTDQDVKDLRKFINDNPKIKNILSIQFDPTGKNGTYFKSRNIDDLSGGQILRDILVEKDHVFPINQIKVLEKPTKTSMGVLEGGALSESPFNKVLTTSHFNNSLRNKIQGYLNSKTLNKDAIKQINNTLNGLDMTIYHDGKYYGGRIKPSILKQMNALGYNEIDISNDVVKNIKEQDLAIKDLKSKKFSDLSITKAIKNSRFALPFVLGTGAYNLGEDVLKETGLVDKTYEQVASADGAPIVEEGFTTGEKAFLGGAGAATGAAVFPKVRSVYGKLLKPVLKTLAPIGTPLGVLGVESYLQAKDKESSIGERLTNPLTYAGLPLATLGGEVVKNKTLQTILNLGLPQKIIRMGTPVGLASMAVSSLVGAAMDAQKEYDAMTPHQQQLFREEQEKFAQDFDDMENLKYASGGRAGFADGPMDPKRRTLLKILGGIMSLPVVAKYFQLAEPLAPVAKKAFTIVEKLKNTTTEMPSWFPSFIDKFRKEGKAEPIFETKRVDNPEPPYGYNVEKTDNVIGTTYTNDNVPGVKVEDYDGQISVQWENEYSQPISMEYTAPNVKGPNMERVDKYMYEGPDMEIKPKGDFSAVDARAYATDPDGGYDVEAEVVGKIDDMFEGTSRTMEEYATGKPVKKLSSGEEQLIQAEVRAESMADAAKDLDD